MHVSKYLPKFKKLAEAGKHLYSLRENRIVIEVLAKEELKVGSLFVAAPDEYKTATSENRDTTALVLMVGEGYYDDKTLESIPMDIQPGNIVLLSNYAMKYYSSFPGIVDFTKNTLALTRDTEIHMIWKTQEDYEAYKALLNE